MSAVRNNEVTYMYRCPECGTEYTVVPEACAVCGHETEADAHIDLFAAAQEQERQAAALQQERQAEYRRQREAKAAAAANHANHTEAKTDSPPQAKPAGDGAAFPELETVSVTEKPLVRSGSGDIAEGAESAGSTRRGSTNTGKKLAAAGCAAALAVGVGGYALFHGKPPGFEKSTVGTFYLKGTSLWFLDGRNANRVCLNNAVFSDVSERDRYLAEDFSDRLDSLLYVSPDGSEFYYPKDVSFENSECTLMHCTAKHPEQAEEIATLRLDESDFNYSGFAYAYSVNMPNKTDSDFQKMNPPYLVSGDAVYYRNPDGAFCCTQNGSTEELAPYVQRFWSIPDSPEVFYIAMSDLEEYKKARSWLNGQDGITIFRPEYECMEPYLLTSITDDTPNVQVHSDDFALYCAAPGEKPELLIDRMEDWAPIREDCPQYLYYTQFIADDGEEYTALMRYDMAEKAAAEILREEPDCRLSVVSFYPTGECYYIKSVVTQAQIDEWYAELKGRSEAVRSDTGSLYMYAMAPGNMRLYYMDAAGGTSLLSSKGEVQAATPWQAVSHCRNKPLVCFTEYKLGSSQARVFLRGQEIPLEFDHENGIYTVPDFLDFSADGTLLIGEYHDYTAYNGNPMQSIFPVKMTAGQIRGVAPITLKLVSDSAENALLICAEQDDVPAELLRIVDTDMYYKDQKIASGMQHKVCILQNRYRQVCFIADEVTPGPNDSAMISMSKAYCGTLMRRAGGRTEKIAESVTGFIPTESNQFMIICGEKGKDGILNYCCGDTWYQADEGVSALLGVRVMQEK